MSVVFWTILWAFLGLACLVVYHFMILYWDVDPIFPSIPVSEIILRVINTYFSENLLIFIDNLYIFISSENNLVWTFIWLLFLLWSTLLLVYILRSK